MDIDFVRNRRPCMCDFVRRRSTILVLLVAAAATIYGCAQTPVASDPKGGVSTGAESPIPPTAPSTGIGVVDLKSLPDTIGIEHQDRINRFNRMSAIAGIQPPSVDDMQLEAGQVPGFSYAIPVVRVRFEERVFFDFNKDAIRSDAEKILDVMAENMKRDVPDAKLTVLGHTDAIGSDGFNFDLSQRRAASVMRALYQRGVNLGTMSTVAVGKTQPIASNRSDEGRALNRRVEFMISASEQANVTLVSKRRVISEFLDIDEKVVPHQSPKLVVLKPVSTGSRTPKGVEPVQLTQTQTVQGKKPASEAEVARLAPIPEPKTVTPKQFHQAQLNNEFDL